MIKSTFWHEPEGHAFCLRDSAFSDYRSINREFSEAFNRDGACSVPGFIKLGVLSEFSEIPITVEFDPLGPNPVESEKWDSVREFALEAKGDSIILESAIGDEFGSIEAGPGSFGIRFHSGGQDSLSEDGSSEDYYLVQIWRR